MVRTTGYVLAFGILALRCFSRRRKMSHHAMYFQRKIGCCVSKILSYLLWLGTEGQGGVASFTSCYMYLAKATCTSHLIDQLYIETSMSHSNTTQCNSHVHYGYCLCNSC